MALFPAQRNYVWETSKVTFFSLFGFTMWGRRLIELSLRRKTPKK